MYCEIIELCVLCVNIVLDEFQVSSLTHLSDLKKLDKKAKVREMPHVKSQQS